METFLCTLSTDKDRALLHVETQSSEEVIAITDIRISGHAHILVSQYTFKSSKKKKRLHKI